MLRLLEAIHITRPGLWLALYIRLLSTMSLISFEPDATEFSSALLRALELLSTQYFPQPLGDPAFGPPPVSWSQVVVRVVAVDNRRLSTVFSRRWARRGRAIAGGVVGFVLDRGAHPPLVDRRD